MDGIDIYVVLFVWLLGYFVGCYLESRSDNEEQKVKPKFAAQKGQKHRKTIFNMIFQYLEDAMAFPDVLPKTLDKLADEIKILHQQLAFITHQPVGAIGDIKPCVCKKNVGIHGVKDCNVDENLMQQVGIPVGVLPKNINHLHKQTTTQEKLPVKIEKNQFELVELDDNKYDPSLLMDVQNFNGLCAQCAQCGEKWLNSTPFELPMLADRRIIRYFCQPSCGFEYAYNLTKKTPDIWVRLLTSDM